MGLDLFHYKVIQQSDDKASGRRETLNVSEFPEEFRKKFEPFIFNLDVEYIDWVSTYQELFQMSFDDFSAKYEMFMERDDGLYFFCPKDCENPWGDPLKFTIHADQCKKLMQSDPHVKAVCTGGQRGCMNADFFKKFDTFDIVIDAKTVDATTQFCDGTDCMETFIQNFILNWDDTSFMMVDY